MTRWHVTGSVDRESAMQRLSAADRFDAFGIATAAEECAGAALFDVIEDGAPVASFAVRLLDRAAGRELNCVAAGGHAAKIDVTRVIDAALVQIAREHGAAIVTATTARRGLVRKMQALGYRPGATLLGKRLNAPQ